MKTVKKKSLNDVTFCKCRQKSNPTHRNSPIFSGEIENKELASGPTQLPLPVATTEYRN